MKIESEQTKYLPIGWKGAVLGAILFLKNGFAFKSNSYQEAGTPVIRISDIQDGVVTTKSSIRIKASEEFNNYLVHKGDILIAMSGATTGKYGIYKQKELAYQNQRVGNFRLYSDDLINKKFIFFLLGSLKRKIEIKAYGGAQPNISGKNIERLKFNLPPLPEQHRIVAKIEELFSELDNGIESLKKAREQLKTYRQAVLKYAFEGKLTKEWGTQQRQAGNSPEPAEKLLEQIKTEREKHYQKQLEDWKRACEQAKTEGKKKPAKPKKPKELASITEKELAELPELPEWWGWVKIDCLSDFDQFALKAGPFGSALRKSCYVKNGYKIYGQEQVIRNDHKYGDYYISEEKYQEMITCKVKPKDILVSLVGTIGKILILPEKIEEGIINPRLIKISLNPKSMLPEFFKFYFESAFLKNLYRLKTHGATMDILNLGIIQDLPFLFCSTSEQLQIISEIESRLSVCDKLEQTIEESLKKAEALRQSILKKAFAGELTRDWREKHPELITGENSAERLLERIKAEKALAAGREKLRSKKMKKK